MSKGAGDAGGGGGGGGGKPPRPVWKTLAAWLINGLVLIPFSMLIAYLGVRFFGQSWATAVFVTGTFVTSIVAFGVVIEPRLIKRYPNIADWIKI